MAKSYRAQRHDVVRAKQSSNSDETHHPHLKKAQILRVLPQQGSKKTLELFAGRGNLTSLYEQFGDVDAYDRKYLGTGDSFIVFHRLIHERKTYDVIDIDPYGFPNRFFPDVFLLMSDGYMFLTMPKPYVNILNGITRTHLESYYGEANPSLDVVLAQYIRWGLCHWRKVEVLDVAECRSIWRIALRVTKVKATEYTGVNNRLTTYTHYASNQLDMFSEDN